MFYHKLSSGRAPRLRWLAWWVWWRQWLYRLSFGDSYQRQIPVQPSASSGFPFQPDDLSLDPLLYMTLCGCKREQKSWFFYSCSFDSLVELPFCAIPFEVFILCVKVHLLLPFYRLPLYPFIPISVSPSSQFLFIHLFFISLLPSVCRVLGRPIMTTR